MISTILLAITIIAFAFYVYKNPPSRVSIPQNISVTPNTATTSNTSTSTNICMDYSEELMNTLEIDLIKDMILGYRDNQLVHINAAEKFSDAHSIWFDLVTLKKFIYHIEYKALNKDNTINPENLGLRIYYSRYPDEIPGQYADLHSVQENYAKHHTLIAIPTNRRKETTTNIDFNPLDTDTFWEGIPSNYTGPIASLSISQDRQSQITGAQNHGSLIPPGNTSGLFI
ncbi:hypothetical protein [Olleya sp. HaHaR_3_96]|uniref:hypothetical protein n=1 Tax=Olleya sp. HaHaR_3_96 TaxID=2745560 RepID=UPI001C4F985B|nr:hypothetical protein [Olleya sp. HaHaR_3_96]QXP60224.1 hypothetical protein H0I26_00855 [Olleya sp. HaHaR_3_96]